MERNIHPGCWAVALGGALIGTAAYWQREQIEAAIQQYRDPEQPTIVVREPIDSEEEITATETTIPPSYSTVDVPRSDQYLSEMNWGKESDDLNRIVISINDIQEPIVLNFDLSSIPSEIVLLVPSYTDTHLELTPSASYTVDILNETTAFTGCYVDIVTMEGVYIGRAYELYDRSTGFVTWIIKDELPLPTESPVG